MVNIGDKAPDFCLKNQDEKELCLQDYRGKRVVLYFYPKDNTPGCTLEAVSFTYHEKKFQELNTVVFGISPDSCESHRKFQAKHDLTVTLLSDPEHEVLEKYDVWKIKKMYGKEFHGVIRSTFIIGPDGMIEHSWTKVRVKGHIEEVIEKIKELHNKI